MAHLKKNGFPELVTRQGQESGSWTLLIAPPPEIGPIFNRNGIEISGRIEVIDHGEDFDAAKFNRNLADDERAGNWGWGRYSFFARHPLILAKIRNALEKR